MTLLVPGEIDSVTLDDTRIDSVAVDSWTVVDLVFGKKSVRKLRGRIEPIGTTSGR